MNPIPSKRPIVLVTGVSRKIGIGAAIVLALAEAGWDVAMTYWRPYDDTMPWGSEPQEALTILDQVRMFAPRSESIEADLSDIAAPKQIFDFVEQTIGPVSALILSHCQSVDSNIYNTQTGTMDDIGIVLENFYGLDRVEKIVPFPQRILCVSYI